MKIERQTNYTTNLWMPVKNNVVYMRDEWHNLSISQKFFITSKTIAHVAGSLFATLFTLPTDGLVKIGQNITCLGKRKVEHMSIKETAGCAANLYTPYVVTALIFLGISYAAYGNRSDSNMNIPILLGLAGLCLGILRHYYLKSEPIKQLDVSGLSPFEAGKLHGETYRSQIQKIYTEIFKITDFKKLRQSSSRDFFMQQFPYGLREEMFGLAKGADVKIRDVHDIHTFLDVDPGRFGCSALAWRVRNKQERIVAANHSINETNDKIDDAFLSDSRGRRDRLLKSKSSDPQKVLQSSNTPYTIQSIVFHPSKGSIEIAAAKGNASYKRMHTFPLFSQDDLPQDESIQLMRNLDWPWSFLGQNTLILIRTLQDKKIASITFPGFLGVLSGINEDGLCLAACQNGKVRNHHNLPFHTLFLNTLSNCATTSQAEEYLAKNPSGSSINVVVADKKGATSIEMSLDKNNFCRTVGSISLNLPRDKSRGF